MNNFAHIAGFVAGFLACSIALLNRRVSVLLALACTASKRDFVVCCPLQNSVKHYRAEYFCCGPCLISNSGSSLHAPLMPMSSEGLHFLQLCLADITLSCVEFERVL